MEYKTPKHIYLEQSEIIPAPIKVRKYAHGYHAKAPTQNKARVWSSERISWITRRIYSTCYGNGSILWIILDGQRVTVSLKGK